MPGRTGAGLTDDLAELTDHMVANGNAGLRHHWGLWYDRRRDDHEMIRRIDADVWPPFFEQPWARSGEGRAWDGLSRYDLTRFNPWYFDRLREFAGLCAQKGLLFVNAMYFQHNILEAGAHWADFPWRSANNINNTGFPEPPPYAAGKRVFMADQFYDVTHPVRRELHRAYIRQSLANLADESNVLHVLGEEYSGPLHFMEFWLDTLAEWEREKIRDAPTPLILSPNRGEDSPRTFSRIEPPNPPPAPPRSGALLSSGTGATTRSALTGLSAPKDVQDAILADPTRGPLIDVIDFKYWWRAGEKEFAPKGGQNLAPRQHEREAKVRRPGDTDLARMAAEYRAKFPSKAVICDFDSGAWAFVCAGGSLPNLPKTTDARLLKAVPRMQPWPEATRKDRWVLREAGQQYLIYSNASATKELDLSEARGLFHVFTVNRRTGDLLEHPDNVRAGGVVKLPVGETDENIVWMTKE